MAITKERKAELVKQFGKNEKDSGATEVQIAILTDEMIKKAQKESKKYKGIDVCDLIDGSMESINEIIKELEKDKILEEENEI